MRKLDKNPDILKKAAQCGVFYYEIAEKLGVVDTTFSRWLRKPVTNELRQKIFATIDEIALERNKEIATR